MIPKDFTIKTNEGTLIINVKEMAKLVKTYCCTHKNCIEEECAFLYFSEQSQSYYCSLAKSPKLWRVEV